MPIGKGARVRLTKPLDDNWTRLRPNDEGEIIDITVLPESLGGQRQIWVKFDNGVSLALIENRDSYEYWYPYRGSK